MDKRNLQKMGGRLTVGRWTLAPSIGVQIPAPQQINFSQQSKYNIGGNEC